MAIPLPVLHVFYTMFGSMSRAYPWVLYDLHFRECKVLQVQGLKLGRLLIAITEYRVIYQWRPM